MKKEYQHDEAMDILQNAEIMTCHCDSTLRQSSPKSETKINK